MIIVTGATGKLGRMIVEGLLKNTSPDQIGVSVRDPEKASDLQERGVRVRKGDFGDGESLRHALEGASQVLIVSSNSAGASAVELHRSAIEAAKVSGAQRILYTSHMGSNPNSHFAPMRDHAATEEILKTSGVAFTSLRNGFYAESGLMLLGDALQTGTFTAPEDGPVSWTTHADLAEAMVIALTEEGRLDGLTAALTAAEALDLNALAEIASKLNGREIKRVTVTDEEYRASMIARGVPEMWANLSVGLFAASRNGEFAAVDPMLENLLRRPAISMEEFLGSRISKPMQSLQ
ncbi:MAG: NAD(P)H-binding protein [Capsulimonas sp.]|uniref:NAD(P)H-binding protein n=1 Tax=Capsulimonas sp. TaxID=2494211 RepID=UPI0032645AD4